MGVAITELLESHEIKLSELKGKILAVDAFNILYMFTTTIRGPDGSPLMNSKGEITSHLTGLFSRFSNLMEKGIKFAFVFDGEAPELKRAERSRRSKLKEEAKELYEAAKQAQDIENMKKYAARTVFLTKEMIDEAKELISAMGMPIIEAPSEGEAQAAHLVKRGDAYAVLSQDADALLNETPLMIRNLSISAKRKMPGQYNHKAIEPEIINLKQNLEKLNITQDELIMLAILVGTDYNYGGIKGIGPKKAIKLIEKHKDNPEKIFEEVNWNEHYTFSWKKIYDTIKNMPTTNNYDLTFKDPDTDKIKEILVKKHNFSEERVNATLKKLDEYKKINAQKGLSDFF
ncbi:MAG: flap endonuclease-1 [Candidatus Woesearchaeota archaeon]